MYSKETIKKYVAMVKEKIEQYNNIPVSDIKMTVSNGNIKIGRVMNVSIPAGISCGNCAGCIGYCYDVKANFVYPSVLDARTRNYSILIRDRDRFFREISEKMDRRKKNKFFRFHVAGEILDMDYFDRMVKIAAGHPDFIVWTYTKMYHIVNAYIAAGNTIPENFKIMFSEWDGMPMYNPYNMPIFTCKLKDGNKNHDPEFFKTLHKCPGNCDVCKAAGRGCIAGESTYADEH